MVAPGLMAGYVLVLAVLLLGSAIATIGDRLGTKVGKARLSLWGMRPRKTAVAITILTGGIISATTLGILFAFSEQLRTGVFELESIQKKLRKAREDLDQTRVERTQIERERDEARSEQVVAEKRLKSTRTFLVEAIARQKQTEVQLGAVANRAVALRNEAERLQQEQQALVRQRDAVIVQIEQRNEEILKRDREIAQQEERLGRQDERIDRQGQAIGSQKQEIQQQQTAIKAQQSDLEAQRSEIAERDSQIAAQLAVVAQGKQQLKELEQTQQFLDQAIRRREQELQQIRQGNVAITRNEALASRILRVIVPSAADQAIDRLLQEANQVALAKVSPGVQPDSQVPTIQVTQADVDRVRREIEDGREYVVRILSAGNYVRGEKNILVFTEVVPNQVIFAENAILATTSVNPETMEAGQIRDRISLLLEASRFRAVRAGIVSEQTLIGDEGVASLVQFYERLQQMEGLVSLQAVTSVPVYTAGPLRIDLVALRDGQEVFRTGDRAAPPESNGDGSKDNKPNASNLDNTGTRGKRDGN